MVFIDQTAAVAQRIISLALVPAAAQQKRWWHAAVHNVFCYHAVGQIMVTHVINIATLSSFLNCTLFQMSQWELLLQKLRWYKSDFIAILISREQKRRTVRSTSSFIVRKATWIAMVQQSICMLTAAEQPTNMKILRAHHTCQISKADDTLSGEFLHLVSYNQRHVTGNPILLPTINGSYLVHASPAAELPRSLSIYRSFLAQLTGYWHQQDTSTGTLHPAVA